MGDALAPGFLIAVPQLQDPNFRQTVVLLLQSGQDGALGIIVNRETSLLLRDLCRDHNISYSGDPAKRVRQGGPVQPEQGLVVMGDDPPDPEARCVATGLHVSASTGTLTRLCSLPECRFHCFAGYAGWAPGQLEREISEGTWIVGNVDPALILDHSPDEMWVKALNDNGIDPRAIVPGDSES
jgi:putative transcriptional regulator